jgi:mRNA interferase MazF
MIPQPGEVWIADIPFTSGTASKLRPVLVLWTDAADVVVAALLRPRPVRAQTSPCKTGRRPVCVWLPQ